MGTCSRFLATGLPHTKSPLLSIGAMLFNSTSLLRHDPLNICKLHEVQAELRRDGLVSRVSNNLSTLSAEASNSTWISKVGAFTIPSIVEKQNLTPFVMDVYGDTPVGLASHLRWPDWLEKALSRLNPQQKHNRCVQESQSRRPQWK